jgi:UDP-perosamine 4-acetyltransferase
MASNNRPLVILGAGGHARVVIDCWRASGGLVAGLLDAAVQDPIDDVPILGGDRELERACFVGKHTFILGLGDIAVRRRLIDRLDQASAALEIVRHPSAIVSLRCQIADGVLLAPGAIVNAGATIDRHAVINTGAIVEHDCVVGENAFVGPGTRMGGGVHIGPDVMLGLGVIVLPGIRIEAGAVVGAGAVVTEPVARGMRMAGVPARAILA